MVSDSSFQLLHRPPWEMSTNLSAVTRKSSSVDEPVWIIICVILAVLLLAVLTFLVIRLVLRMRRRSQHFQEEVEDEGPPQRADRERLVFAYFPTQAPAIVRMRRLVKKTGLLPVEINAVAPVTDYVKQSTSSSTDLAGNKGGDDVCAVCLEDMSEGSRTRRLPCGHWFDADCIDVWASKANRCPVCNTPIISEEELEKRRLGVFEAVERNGRQRRRRTRGDNGTFELGLAAEARIELEDSVLAGRQQEIQTRP